jgi:hypothetical protein
MPGHAPIDLTGAVAPDQDGMQGNTRVWYLVRELGWIDSCKTAPTLYAEERGFWSNDDIYAPPMIG